jgi:hypothetical protein
MSSSSRPKGFFLCPVKVKVPQAELGRVAVRQSEQQRCKTVDANVEQMCKDLHSACGCATRPSKCVRVCVLVCAVFHGLQWRWRCQRVEWRGVGLGVAVASQSSSAATLSRCMHERGGRGQRGLRAQGGGSSPLGGGGLSKGAAGRRVEQHRCYTVDAHISRWMGSRGDAGCMCVCGGGGGTPSFGGGVIEWR